MKTIGITIFDDFTDIDFFLMWDILGRNKTDWEIKILGKEDRHCSTHGLYIPTDGHLSEANELDIVLFTSGKSGVPAVLADDDFLKAFSLNPDKQIIGSICAGSFILYKLGLLNNMTMTTHPDAKVGLEALGGHVIDKPFVCNGNIATAGGCLAAIYLIGWFVERIYGVDKRKDTLKEVIPAGQSDIFETLITESIANGF